MGRILAIDFGTKRTGLAVTDPMQIIATGLDTVSTIELLDYLRKYCLRESVESFVVGEAKNLDGSPAQSAESIEAFVKKLGNVFPEVPIHRIDERYTSKMAFQTMIDTGLGKKKRKDKALVDKIAAVIILQSYLDQQSYKQ